MLAPQLPLRATGFARALGVLLLLTGIVAMHSAVFALPDHEHGPAAAHGTNHDSAARQGIGVLDSATMSAEHGLDRSHTPDDLLPMALSELGLTSPVSDHGAGGMDCAGGGCAGNHGGMHGCVFILSAIALLFGLVLLYRMAVDRPGTNIARPRALRRRRERAPPWTVLSLAELSILRI